MTNYEQDAVSWYTLFHFVVGVVAYGFTRLILDGQKNITPDKQNLLVWTCFVGFLLLHTLWEFLETSPTFRKVWNEGGVDLFDCWKGLADNFKYKGDSFANCALDTIAFVGGFWMGYALIGVPELGTNATDPSG